jgi:hypothetical protein
VCRLSKRYPQGHDYWYGYSEASRRFLLEGREAYLVLGCIGNDTAYAIPVSAIEKVLDRLHKTPDTHWHIQLNENKNGKLELVIPKSAPMPLTDFELKLAAAEGP